MRLKGGPKKVTRRGTLYGCSAVQGNGFARSLAPAAFAAAAAAIAFPFETVVVASVDSDGKKVGTRLRELAPAGSRNLLPALLTTPVCSRQLTQIPSYIRAKGKTSPD